MARHSETRYEASSGTYSIRITPDADGASSGEVRDKLNRLIDSWSFEGTGEVWVGVGNHTQGSISEVGFPPTPWRLDHVG